MKILKIAWTCWGFEFTWLDPPEEFRGQKPLGVGKTLLKRERIAQVPKTRFSGIRM
jgi:hypothetical protein